MAEVTIKDIAEKTGVSYATVSRTLNNRSGVSPSTRDLIIETAKEMGYKPNLHARSLKTNRTLTIALILPDIANPFFADIALSVNDAAFSKGYTTILCSTNWNVAIEEAQLSLLLQQRVDGIIFKPSDRCPDRYAEISIPKIMIANMQAEGMDYIEVDNFHGGKMAAEHLLACGYRKPAFIGGSKESVSNEDRFKGFQSVFIAQGIQIPQHHIGEGPFSLESGYKLTKQMMNLAEKPDCFFCGNDMIALGALQYLTENKFRIPEQVGIIGFDDVYFSSLPQIQLTTLSQPRSLMGQKAADLLIQRIEKKQTVQEQHILLQPELIIRKSTKELNHAH